MTRRLLPLLAATLLATAGCVGPLTDTGDSPDVLVTHYPIEFLASEIAGDDVDVDALVEGGQPHDFEPSFEDRSALEDASLVVYQGAGFSPGVEGMLASAGEDGPDSLALVDTVDTIVHEDEHRHGAGKGNHSNHEDRDAGDQDEEHESEHEREHDEHAEGREDPHTWLDPVRMTQHAEAIRDAMQEAFPEHEEAFANRTADLVDDLEALHGDFEAGLATCEVRTAVVNHNAFAYLGDRYNITFEAAHGLSPDAEPSAETIDRLAEIVDHHNLTTVFFEEFVSPEVVETIADETGADTEVLSPLAALTDEQRADGETYPTRMRANLHALEDAMRCTSPGA